MSRTRTTKKKDGTFRLNIDLTEAELKCLWHRTNQGGSCFLESYDELKDTEYALMSDREFIRCDTFFIWNSIDQILEYNLDSVDSNNE